MKLRLTLKVETWMILVLCISGALVFRATEHGKLTRFEKQENRVQFSSPYLPFRLCYWDRTLHHIDVLSMYIVMISIQLGAIKF